ncbi:MAG: hypothetical protein PUH70_08690 [Clostridiales bacterium]|nr:hypothetical protein [Clostridiales bacterium]MDY5514699.1 hypothetical protein [Candidatus Ventricola sp.]
MYTIILGDQTEITNLELNGNNFISGQIIPDETFSEGNLTHVIIRSENGFQEFRDMYLVANRVIDGQSWFVIAEKTEEMKRAERIAQLEAQNAMLTECLLEMSEIVYG